MKRIERLVRRINHCGVCETDPYQIIKGSFSRLLKLKPPLGNVMDPAGVISSRVCREDHSGFTGHTREEIIEASRDGQKLPRP
ncbi:hypothetical protein HY946_01185 [Candidatus Gottesmanbacteria bacterium]|nr:hypothetical protein [Candidatus Gottesmanbacteria bacterium]